MAKKLKQLNQSGMVSIIVTIILIIVMSLIVIAMSRNSVRESRQSLDRQLSDQAFYNAETGINDWADYLVNNPTAPQEKTDCNAINPPGFTAPVPNTNIGTSGANSYTCVLYNKTPDELSYQGIGLDNAKTIPISSSTGAESIIINWTAAEGDTKVSGCAGTTTGGVLPSALPVDCNVGVLEVTIIDTTTLNRTALKDNSFIAYLLPSVSGGVSSLSRASAVSPDNQGKRILVSCSSDSCELTITNLGLAPGATYYLNIKSLYNKSNLTIKGVDASSNPVKFIGAQYMLDVTGKASDVLRRVKVMLPTNSQLDGPNFAIQTSESLCKLIDVNVGAPGGSTARWNENADGDPANECPIN